MNRKLGILLLTVLAAVPARAGVGVWTPFGPGVPNVPRVAAAPGSLYAVRPNEGIFRSQDDGESWQWWSLGIGRARSIQVDYVAVDATQPLDLYAATFEQQIERSFDGGRTWVRVDPIPGDPSPKILTVAGSGGMFYAGTLLGLFVLRDGEWSRLLEDTVWSIAFGPGALYAGTEQTLKKSTDGGLTWSTLLSGAQFGSVAVAPSDPSTVYASANGHIQASSDGGSTWVGRSLFAAQVAVSPAASNHLVAAQGQGLSWSDDGGVTDHQTSSYVSFSVAADPVRPGTTQNGRTLRSLNRGQTWRPMGDSPGRIVVDLVVHPEAPFVLLAATRGEGVRISRDGGRTWAPYNVGLARPGIEDILKLYPDPIEPGRFFALPASGGVFEITVD